MIRRLRWWWDRYVVAPLTPIDESLAACCGCGRHRIRHVFFDLGEMWCDNCYLLPGTRIELAHVTLSTQVANRTWGAIRMYVATYLAWQAGSQR